MKIFIMAIMMVLIFVVSGKQEDNRIEATRNLPKGVHITERNCEDCCGSGNKWIEHTEYVGGGSAIIEYRDSDGFLLRRRFKNYTKRKVHTKDMGRVKVPCKKCKGTGKRLTYDKDYNDKQKPAQGVTQGAGWYNARLRN